MEKTKLLADVKKDINDARDRIRKDEISKMVIQIDMAKVTLAKLEKKLEEYMSSKEDDSIFILNDKLKACGR